MKRLISICVLLAGLLAPQVTEAKSSWRWSKKELKAIAKLEKKVTQKGNEYTVESEHWISKTQIDKRFTAELAFFMELFFDTYTSTIKSKLIVDKKPEVVVFQDDRLYREKLGDRPFSPGLFRGVWDDSGAWTDFSLYTCVRSTKERQFANFSRSILTGEGARALFRRSLGQAKASPWLEEGLVTYFESCDLHEKKVVNSKTRYSRSKYRKALQKITKDKKQTLPGLEWLLNLRENEWNPDNKGAKGQLHFAYAESFVALLMTTGKYKKTLVQMIEQMKLKKPLVDEKQLKNLQKKWHHFLRWKV